MPSRLALSLLAALVVGAAATVSTPRAAAQTPGPGRTAPPAAAVVLPDPAGPRRQVIDYLNSLAHDQLAMRAAEIAGIRTRADAEQRAAANRATVLELIGGLPDRGAPLATRVHGTIAGDGFRIEKVTYESLPGFVVTANVYLPDGPGPFPAVILTAGHSASGKSSQYSFAANFARAGIAALAWDPISEGERTQYFDPATGASKVGRVTGEHSFASVQAMLLGDHVSRYFVGDAMRAIDYLESRDDIDPTRIGAFGCSGGGTVTSYLTALDPRVRASASACYITSFDALLSGGDPQEAEQSIPDFIARGLDLADWVEMAAPRPHAIVSTTEDMFPFEGTRASYEEAKRIYALYGAEDRLQWITGPGGHGALGPVSGEILAFFTRWLKDESAAPAFTPLRPSAPDDLLVTATGQLANSLGSETIASLTRRHASELLLPGVVVHNPADLAQMRDRIREDARAVARVSARPGDPVPAAQIQGSVARGSYRLDQVEFQMEEGITITGLLAVPARSGRLPALLMMDSRPADSLAAPGGHVDRLARDGRVVLALQPRGTPGGTEDIKSPLLGTYYLLSLRSLLVGKTIVGMRTDDAIRAVSWLRSRPEVDPAAIDLYGMGPLGPVALHAAALDPRIRTVYTENTLLTYRMAVEHEMHQDLAEVALPGVLRKYDLPDLVLAIAPRRVVLVNPVDPVLAPIPAAEARTALDYVLESDRALGTADRVRILGRDPGAVLPID